MAHKWSLLHIIKNKTNVEIKSIVFKNNSKAVLAYTLNNNGKSIEDEIGTLDENDLLVVDGIMGLSTFLNKAENASIVLYI